MIELVVALAATVAALGAVVWSGLSRRRHLHYALVVVFLAALALAIRLAERYGRGLLFEGPAATVRSIHMVVVTATFIALFIVTVTGIRLAKSQGETAAARRPPHRVAAIVFVVLVLLTSALGTAMTVLAQRAE